ncbi:MAG: hypothetical protein P9L90_01275, partial [Candidatus Aadella gelida]|nr:hypothetical protein [Candidatus Aadella gelida]
TPKITKDVETPYIKVLTNQRTSIEDMITESAVMPGMGTTSSQNNMASQTARELVSPLYRVGYANMLFNEKGISELEKLSEELGNIDGMEEATFINRVKSTFTEAVSMATDEWLLKVHGNLMQETGHDGWQKIWDNRNYQKDLLSVYLEIIWSELQKIEKAKGITGRIRGTESTYKALRNVAIKVFAEQFNAPAKPRSLGAAANTELAAQEAAFEVKRENLNSIIDIVKNGEGATEVIAITNGGDGEIVNAYLEQLSSDIFNAKEPVAVMAHEEVTRRGQFLGLLDAMKAWKEKNGDFKKDGVSLGIMMPGKGTRLSPFTHRLHGIKPFITMLIKAGEKWLSGATASMYTWNQVAYNLKRMGFRGIAWKWGDEPQIASKSLGSLNYDLSETDIVRFGSTMLVTDDLAENKEWINADEEGNLVGWARRRNRKDLLERLGVEETDDAKAFVHIGSPAFSYIFIEEAMKVFEDVPQESWIDVDGYLIEALTMDKETWDSEYHMERRVGATGIETVLKNCPDFYQRAQKLRENINRRRGKALDAQLNIKVINFGEDLYWGDVGQLDAARKAFYNVNKDDYDGEFARMLAGIEDVNPDEFGNRVIGDCVYPKDGSVKNSTLINTKIYGSADISDAVLVDSDLRNVMVGAGSVVYNSTVIDLTVGENAFSFMSVGNKIDVQERSVHTSMPKDISDISKGLDNWRAPTLDDKGNSINIGKGELYNEPQFGNPMSFNEMREIMRQREVSPQAIESEIDAKLRAPIKEKLERYQQLASKFTPLKFGTSGLRGFIAVMTDMEMYINTQGFLKSQNVQPGEVVVIGGDRRPSTPDIMTAVGKAVEDYGAIP